MTKIGIFFAYWTHDYTADFKYYVKKAAKLGFDVLEIDPGALLDFSKLELNELKKLAEDSNIELTFGLGFPKDCDMASENESLRKNGLAFAKKIIDVVGLMGGKQLPGIIHSCWPGIMEEGITDKRPYLERSTAAMKEVAKILEHKGIIHSIEMVNRFEHYLLNTVEEGIAFVEAIGSPNIKLLLDVFHLNIEETDMCRAIESAGKHIGYIHLGENNRNLPGRGSMPWKDISGAVRKCDYNGCIVLEPFVMMGGPIARDVRVWRNLVEHTDENALDTYAKESLEFVRSIF